MQKCCIGFALLISTAALAMSVWNYQQADARAEAAIKRREKALVENHRPGIVRLCKEWGLKEGPSPDAETVDELLLPLAPLLEGLGR